MTGLLRKDILLIAKRYRTSLLYLLIAALLAIRRERVDLVLGAYLFVSMLMIQADLITIDNEQKNWKKMERSLPVAAYQIVLEKYVAALLFLLAGGIVFLLCSILEKVNVGKSLWLAFPTATFLLAACCAALSLQIPVLYRFGKRVGVAVFLLLGAGACIAGMGIRWGNCGDAGLVSLLSSPTISFLLMVAAVILTMLSWLISTRIYHSRDK